ncbi:MAG: hypothetical protein IID41_00510 [Planctomycetes bacterium]|nr:hypothetical protein [Planctomycetota bacterium]
MSDHPTIQEQLTAFANKHELVFRQHGEVGFGRECVGFTHGDDFVAHNPVSMESFAFIPGFEDDSLYPPNGVEDAYHKHNCLCVLVHEGDYDSAMRQLLVWVTHLESLGELEVVGYETGATGIQAAVSGFVAKAIRFKEHP